MQRPEVFYSRCRLYLRFCVLHPHDGTLAIVSIPLSKPLHPHKARCF